MKDPLYAVMAAALAVFEIWLLGQCEALGWFGWMVFVVVTLIVVALVGLGAEATSQFKQDLEIRARHIVREELSRIEWERTQK